MDRHIPMHALPEEIQKVWYYIVLLQQNISRILTDPSKTWGSKFRGFVFILVRWSAVGWWSWEENNHNG